MCKHCYQCKKAAEYYEKYKEKVKKRNREYSQKKYQDFENRELKKKRAREYLKKIYEDPKKKRLYLKKLCEYKNLKLRINN